MVALVTGGCGFLGSAIVAELHQRGTKVRVLAVEGEPTDNIDDLDVEIIRGDVLDIETCQKAVDGCEVVYHAAAIYKAHMPDPTLMYEVNSAGTFNMLEASKRAGVSRVVYTASIVALGRPTPGTIGDTELPYEAWDLNFHYSRSKYHSSKLAERFAAWGQDVRIVYPGAVLGPGDIRPTPTGRLIINAVSGTALPIYTDGGINYVDVRDAAKVHVLCAEKGKPGGRYLATGHNLDNREMLLEVLRAEGLTKKLRRIPVPVARNLIKVAERVAKLRGMAPPITQTFFDFGLQPGFFSNAITRSELGAEFRPFSETVRDAIEYFRGRGLIPR